MKFLVSMVVLSFISAESFALDCHGTEPFWAADVSSEKIEVAGVVESVSMPVTSVTGAAGYVPDFLQVYANESGKVAVVTSNKCDNGMSPHVFPKEIIIFTDEYTLYGCCGEGVIDEEELGGE